MSKAYGRARTVFAAASGVLCLVIVGVPAAVSATSSQTAVSGTTGLERIERFSIEADVRPNGDLKATEEIVWDFGSATTKHGIFRFVPTVSDGRSTPVRWGLVTSPSKAPTATTVTASDGQSVLRIGDADRTVRGRQTYRLSYVVDGLAADGNVRVSLTGTGWNVPIDAIDLRLRGTAARSPEDVSCQIDGAPTDACTITLADSIVGVHTTRLGVDVIAPVDATIGPSQDESEPTLPQRGDEGRSPWRLPIVVAVGAAMLAGLRWFGLRRVRGGASAVSASDLAGFADPDVRTLVQRSDDGYGLSDEDRSAGRDHDDNDRLFGHDSSFGSGSSGGFGSSSGGDFGGHDDDDHRGSSGGGSGGGSW